MNKTLLFNDIESLPLDLQQQVADFVSFLKVKYLRQKSDEDLTFTDGELAELDRRWQEFESDPDGATEIRDFKKQVRERYGV